MKPSALALCSIFLFAFGIQLFAADETKPYELTKEEREQLKPAEVTGRVIEEDERKKTVEVDGGLRFRLLKDWPIERAGGFVAPVELDSYLHRRFEQLTDSFGRRSEAVDARIKKIEREISELQTSASALKSRNV